MIQSFPRAILHVDGDAFFVSCEVTKNPALRGKPVVTGGERGIASAMSYEAKAIGVTRGMPIAQVRRQFPEVVVLASDFENYLLYARRMYDIVRRYTPDVEEYSIDECFADLTGMRRPLGMSYEEAAVNVKKDLESELGITFSVGLAPTKVLAKVASKHRKPAGLTIIPGKEIDSFLKETPIGKVWGIGPNTAEYLAKFGISTALQFARKSEAWVNEHFTKPHKELWRELNGEAVHVVHRGEHRAHRSVSTTRTFVPTKEREFIFGQLSKNIETATRRLRDNGFFAKKVSLFLKSNDFRYRGMEFTLSRQVSSPYEFLRIASAHFGELWNPRRMYRATGVVLSGIVEADIATQDLFGDSVKVEKMEDVFKAVDEIEDRYGRHAVVFGSTLPVIRRAVPRGIGVALPRPLAVPFLGVVR